MKLACSTWMMPGETFREKIHTAKKYGFQGVEVRLFEEETSVEKIKEIREALREYDVKACSLIMPGDTYRKPLLDDEILKAKVILSKKAIDVAAELNCPTIVCPEYGYQNPLPLFDHPRKPNEKQKKLLLDFLRQVSDYAKEVGTIAMIEPINRYETRFFYSLEDGQNVINEVGSKNLKLLADFFHMNMEEVDIPKAFRRHAKDIVHVHLGDSNRLMPGKGHIDFRTAFTVLREMKYNGYMALECSTGGNPDKIFPECIAFLKSMME